MEMKARRCRGLPIGDQSSVRWAIGRTEGSGTQAYEGVQSRSSESKAERERGDADDDGDGAPVDQRVSMVSMRDGWLRRGRWEREGLRRRSRASKIERGSGQSEDGMMDALKAGGTTRAHLTESSSRLAR